MFKPLAASIFVALFSATSPASLLLAERPPNEVGALPIEIEAFVRERELCDHFRNEPIEGQGPEADERRKLVQENLDVFCPGTDRRLAALKRRFASDEDVLSVLASFEESVEPTCK